MPDEKRHYREIPAAAQPEDRPLIQRIMNLLSDLHRDYHDYKASPPAFSIAERAKMTGLSEADVEEAYAHLKLRRLSLSELQAQGFGLEDSMFYGDSEGAEVDFPHRPMLYLIPQDIYLDPSQPGRRYVYL